MCQMPKALPLSTSAAFGLPLIEQHNVMDYHQMLLLAIGRF